MTTIKVVPVTNKIEYNNVRIEQPVIGNICTEVDNGYGSGVVIPYIVTRISKAKDFTNKVYLKQIKSISEDKSTVTVDDKDTERELKAYFNKSCFEGNYWHYQATHRLSYINWDEYSKYDAGYMK